MFKKHQQNNIHLSHPYPLNFPFCLRPEAATALLDRVDMVSAVVVRATVGRVMVVVIRASFAAVHVVEEADRVMVAHSITKWADLVAPCPTKRRRCLTT